MLAERGDEALLGQIARAELEDEAAHLAQGLARQCAHLVELGRDARLPLFEQHARRAGGDRHAEQRLSHRVMKLLSEVSPLSIRRKLGGLLLGLALEAKRLADLADRARSPAIATVDRGADVVQLDRDGMPVLVAQVHPVRLVAVGVRDLPAVSLLERLAR